MQIELAERRLACPLVVPVHAQLVDHIQHCEMKGRMDIVEDFVTTTKSTTTSNAHWLNCFYAAVGIAGYICLLHSKGLLDHVKT